MGQPELAGRRPLLAPRFHPVAVPVVLRYARVDVAVGDVGIALRVPRYVGWLAKEAVDVRQRRVDVLPRSGLMVGRFLPAAEHHLHAARRIEPDDHVRALVDRPDVVVLVDADAVRERPSVQAPADLADEATVGVKLE